jgi:hypothetical protein
MDTTVYTHALWRVKPGNEEAFIAAWTDLSNVFSALNHPPIWGTLIRSATEPNLFYSFGPWHSAGDVESMRRDENATVALAHLRSLCDEATPGMYFLVRHVEVEGK